MLRAVTAALTRWPAFLATALALSALSVAQLAGCGPCASEPGGIGTAAVLQVLGTLPFAVCRRWPLGALVAGGALALVTSAAGIETSAFQFVALLGMLGMVAVRRRRLVSGPLALAVAAGTVYARRHHDASDIAFQVAIVALTWLLADGVRTQRLLADALAERVRARERARSEELRRTMAEEREHLARELHDVIAHSLSVMVMQAAGARRSLERAPERSREAIEAVEHTGRAALADIRQALGALRAGDGAERPQRPGIDALAELVDGFRRSGLQVRLRSDGSRPALPAPVDLGAYRIAQEALTNCLKHAPRAPVEIELRREPDGVLLRVDSGLGGPEPAAPAPGDGGYGLTGMRERASALGGRLEAGPGPGGGWSVVAHLPVREPA